jgi:hypothetical protein
VGNVAGDKMKYLNPKFRQTRESRWVREFNTGERIVLDSKYRTFECDVGAGEFVDLWRTASPLERIDMEAAFTCFPVDDFAQLVPILASIAADDPVSADRMRSSWKGLPDTADESWSDFLAQLMQYHLKQGVPYRTAAENKYFRVLTNNSDFRIERLIHDAKDVPSEAQFAELERLATSPLERHAIRLVRHCRFLLVPEVDDPSKSRDDHHDPSLES